MNRMHYRSWYRLDGSDRYLIWYNVQEAEEDLDGVVLDLEGKIPVFTSLASLSAYAQGEGITIVEEESILHNLDAIAQWLRIRNSQTEDSTPIDCNEFLAAWNLLADVSRSIDGNFDADHDLTKPIYLKLFWGNNLPSVTPEGECYIPIWSDEERHIIDKIMFQGLQMFRDSIKPM